MLKMRGTRFQHKLLCAGLALAVGLAGAPVSAAAVDLQFDRAPVHKVLRVLAEAEGVNLIVDQGVSGEISMNARGIDAREAMELVAGVRNLHLEQVGNTLVVSAAPTSLGGNAAQPAAARLNFTQQPVSAVLQALAERAGWNLIIEGPLSQAITAWLEGMEPVEALRLVASAAGLSYQLVDRVLHVKGAAVPAADRIAVHRLDHVDAARAKELVEAFLPGVRVELEATSRSLVVQGTEEQLGDVAAFLDALDTPRPQVLVEARILDVEVDALRSLGVEWEDQLAIDGSGTPQVFYLRMNVDQLDAALRFLQDNGYSQVLASPKISAIDGQEARILIGERVPIVTEFTDAEGRIYQTVEYADAGIGLTIAPIIAADGSVTLEIRTEISSVVDPQARFPTFRTREATSTVRVYDGRPLIIGGLIEEEERERLTGIPYLSRLPVLGGLFGHRTVTSVQTETIIILVPHIVNAEAAPHASPAGGAAGAVDAGEPGGAAAAAAGAGARSGLAQPVSQIAATREMTRGLGTPILSVPPRERGAVSMSLDVMTLRHPAAELQLEREDGHVGVLSRFYASTGDDSGAWSIGAAVRYYLGDREREWSLRPWIDGGAEYAVPLGDDPLLVYSAGAGLQLNVGDYALLEVYARYQYPERPGGLAGLPGRAAQELLGAKLGWRY